MKTREYHEIHIAVLVQLLSFPTLCDPMDCSMPGFPVFTVSWNLLNLMSFELMMPSNYLILCHPLLLLLSIFSRIFPQELALCIGASASAPVLPMNIQCWFPLRLIDFISLQPKVLLRVFSSITTWKHQLFSAQPSLWSNSHIRTWLLGKP